MKIAKILAIITTLCGLAACSSDAFIARGDRLLAAGDVMQAQAAYTQGLHLHPTSTQLRMRLTQAEGRALDSLMAEADAAVDNANFGQALELLTRARTLAVDADDSARRDKIDALHDHLADYAQARARVLQAQGDAIRAVTLAEASARRFGQPTDANALQAMRAEGIARYRRAARNLSQNHPGSAAVQLAMAQRLGDTDVTPRDVLPLWQRFTRQICYQAPSVDVRVKSGIDSEALADALRAHVAESLETWREGCGRGNNPLRVAVDVVSVENDDRSLTAPAAVARPGSTAVVEDTVQVNEKSWDTTTTQVREPRMRQVVHRDCRDSGDNHQLKCSEWRETLQRPVLVDRLKVIERDHMRTYRRVLPHVAEADVVRFERGMMSRRMVVRGHVQIGTDAPQAFAVTVASEDDGHPEIRRDDLVVPADPLVVESAPDMVRDAAVRVAGLAALAARQSAFDAAANLADKAAELGATDPDAAEEIYLLTLAEGWDGGHAMRSFFAARYGMPADEVLANLNRALGRRPPPPGATSTADLALFFPKF